MTTPAPIRVLVADNHPLYREAVTATLRGRPALDVVAQAADGAEALQAIRADRPDVVVLDVRMPGLDGMAVLDAIASEDLDTKALFLSAYLESDLVYAALAAGAAGYLSKDTDAEAICDAVQAVAAGQTVLAPDLQSALAGEIRARAVRDRPALSPREQEILELTAAGCTAAEIAGRLYLSSGTIKTHLGHIYEKLGVSERAAAVATALRRGLIS